MQSTLVTMSNTVGGCETDEASTTNKGSKTKSQVWEHFMGEDVNGGTREKCKYRNEIGAMNQPLTIAFREEDGNFGLTPEKIWEFQVKNAILANFPFASPNFKKVWSSLMIMDMDMEKEILEYYKREKEDLVGQLGNLTSRVCFSIGIMKEAGWISIAAHFINDNFNLVKRLIGFKKLPDNTSALSKADIIESCISDWKLGNKIFSFTSDPDWGLDRSLSGRFNSNMLLDVKYNMGLRCFKNAIVGCYSMYLKDRYYAEDVKNVAEIITFPSNILKFNEIAEEKGLPPINEDWSRGQPVSWSEGSQDWEFCCSLVKLFKKFLLYKNIFFEHSLVEIWEPSIHPDCIRWTELEMAVNYFEEINPIIDLLSNFKYPTSNLYFQSLKKIDSLDGADIFFGMCFTNVKSLYIFCVACVLDPRYKLIFFEYLFAKEGSDFQNDFSPVKTDMVRELFDTLFGIYAKEETSQVSPLSIETANTQEGSPSRSITNQGLSRINDAFPLYLKALRTTKREMTQYLRETMVDVEDPNFDLLGWWKQNRARYPVLSRMARDLLAAPACIYTVKENLGIDLSVLHGVSPELAEAVICSKDWILSNV